MTVPSACVLVSSDVPPTFRPLPSSIARARSSGTPCTSGTATFLTFCPLLTVISTLCPLLMRDPLRGSCEMTVPLSSSEYVSYAEPRRSPIFSSLLMASSFFSPRRFGISISSPPLLT